MNFIIAVVDIGAFFDEYYNGETPPWFVIGEMTVVGKTPPECSSFPAFQTAFGIIIRCAWLQIIKF